jgi:hypothetical protein
MRRACGQRETRVMEAALLLGPILVGVGLLVLSVRALSRKEEERKGLELIQGQAPWNNTAMNSKKIGESRP